jgi:uncharacterized membrane protein YbhN (UPF0104 family)
MQRSTPRGKGRIVWIVKLALALLFLYVLIHNISFDAISLAFAGAYMPYIFAALLLLPLNIWLQYRKWAVMLRSVYPSVPASEVRSSLLLGFSFGLATPARIGEFGGRAFAVRDAEPLTLMGLTALDKGLTMVVTILAGVIGAVVFHFMHPFFDYPFSLTALLLFLAAAALLVMLVYRLRGRVVLPAGRISTMLRRLREALTQFDRKALRRSFLVSVLFYVTFAAQFFLLLSAFGPLDVLSAVAGISTIMLIKTIVPPITLGELGIREGAAVVVFGHAGILSAAAFSASMLLFAINLLLPALAGLPLLLRMPLSRTAKR